MPSIKRILGLAFAALAALLHLWYGGVLAAPEVKRRKAARRRLQASTAKPPTRGQ